MKTPHEKYFAVKVQGHSMNPLLKQGDIIVAKKISSRSHYNKGDIIVFKRDGVNTIHMVENTITDTDGKTYYITMGLNPETNSKVDSVLVSSNPLYGFKGKAHRIENGNLFESFGSFFSICAIILKIGLIVIWLWLSAAFYGSL